jgi:formate hydrogenlyase subunit 3/multisubunit Na+/H+ antiporter MnhD subunit
MVSALALVVTARAAIPFLIAWEVMAVVAYFLIVFDRERAEVRRAGLLYIVATHTGTLILFALFASWGGGAGDLTFASLAARPPGGSTAAWLLLLAGVGFGLKAGIVPLHFWLPSAHASAPSHVSALLSGVVIKMGIYGFMRVIVLMGALPAWVGWVLLASGVVSGVLGVIWALAQHEIKRLLAFHSVENIGIILIGLGTGILGTAHARPLVALLGFAGAALHTLNHALFKSLLFLGAGSVIHATGLRDIDRLGGLARHMPGTATAFLIGSAAIVGIPPLNGFVSEWLVFRSLFESGTNDGTIRIAVLGAAALALIGALALMCFAKVVGVLFLGEPREAPPGRAHESPAGMVRPMLALAGACVLMGLAPVAILPSMLRTGSLLAGVPFSAGGVLEAAAVPLTALALVLAVVAIMLMALVSLAHRGRPLERAGTWGCGFPERSARMQYTASSFAAPLLLGFRGIAGIHVTRTLHTFATHATDPVLNGVVIRGWHAVRSAAGRLRPIQRGALSLYLLYVVATLIVLLCWLLVQGRTP